MYRSTYPLGTGRRSHFGNQWFIPWQDFTHTHVSTIAQNTILRQEADANYKGDRQ